MAVASVWIVTRDLSDCDIKAVCPSEDVALEVERRLREAGISTDVEEYEVLEDASEVVPRVEHNVRMDERGVELERWRHAMWPAYEDEKPSYFATFPLGQRIRGVAVWAMSTSGYDEALRLARAALDEAQAQGSV